MRELLRGFPGKPSLPSTASARSSGPDASMADALVPGRAGAATDVLPEPGAHGLAPISAQDTRGRRKEEL